jgi:CheY-like chemotaxis protein
MVIEPMSSLQNFWTKIFGPKLKKNVLVVEDELALLQILVDTLQKKGYEVLSARDGEEGLDVALKKYPDLILLDLLMPKMDGMHLLSHLRLNGGEWGKSVRVIILTNLNDKNAMEQAIKAGVKHYLLKSEYKLEDIMKKVAEVLGES